MDEANMDAMLQEMARSLPAALDMESSDEGGGEGEGESVAVFSRADHLASLGFHDSLVSVLELGGHGEGGETGRVQQSSPNEQREIVGEVGGTGHDTADAEPTAVAIPGRNRSETGMHGTETSAVVASDVEWRQFRSGFMEQLQSSEHEVKVQTGNPSAVNDLVKAISGLQSQQTSQTDSASQPGDGGPSRTSADTSHTSGSTGSASQPTASSSLPHSDTSLLSSSTLARIDMSELDRALEWAKVGGADRPGGQNSVEDRPPPPKCAWGEGEGGENYGGGDSAKDLLSQLAVISREQSHRLAVRSVIERPRPGERAERSGSGEKVNDGAVRESSPLGKEGTDRGDEGRKKTVYIDLRPQHKQPDSEEASSMHLRQSTSESEESDDQISWAVKRRHMKSSLSPPHHNLHQSHTTTGKPTSDNRPSTETDSTKLYHEPGATSGTVETEEKRKGESVEETLHVSEGDGYPVERKGEDLTLGGDASRKEAKEGSIVRSEESKPPLGIVALESAADVDNSPETSSESVLQSSSSSSIVGSSEQVQPLSSGEGGGGGEKSRAMLQQQAVRQHSTESLTLSSEFSSLSEGELAPVKPVRLVVEAGMGTHEGDSAASKKNDNGKKLSAKKSKKKRKGRGKGEQKAALGGIEGVDSTGSSPEMGRAELGTKQDRDKKEGGKKKDRERKGEKRKEGGHKVGETKKSELLRAKKAAIKRLRFDSLTTSSDEERGIDSPRLSRVEEVAEPLPEKEEGGERGRVGGGRSEQESKERLRQRLEYKIISKKPPALFETPATEPLFHQDVSFSPVLSHTNPSVVTDALLVLPLSSSCSLVSLPPSHAHISPEAHLALHSLFVTYLTVSATRCVRSARPAWAGKHRGVSPPHSTASHNKLDLRITALYQTVLDGRLALLVGTSLPQGRKRSVSYPHVLPSETKKPKKSNGAMLAPLNIPRNPSAVELEAVLYQFKLRDLLGEVMNSREEVGPGECDVKRVALPSHILEEIQPLLDMSTRAFFSVHADPDPVTTPISFYWHSMYQPSCLPSTTEAFRTAVALQSTVCVLPLSSLADPDIVFHTVHGAYDFGLSIAGIRLVYGESCLPMDLPSSSSSDDVITDYSLTLALGLRGPDAVYRCMDLVGPEDYNLAKVTDPCSIMALFGSAECQPVHCTRTPYRVAAALSKWFGGRGCLRTGSVLGMTDPRTRSERRKRQRVRFSESDFESEDNLPPPTPDVSFPPLVANRPLLAVLPYEQLLLVLSPLLPPSCYSSVLATCGRLGFDVSGVKRVRLNSKRSAALDIPATMVSHFTPSSTPSSPNILNFTGHPLAAESIQNIPPLPSLLLILGREDALVHGCALKMAIVADLESLQRLNPQLEAHVQLDCPVGALMHALPYTSEKLKTVGSFTSTAATSTSSLPQLAPEWEKEGERHGEEIGFLAVTQSSGLARAVEILQRVFGVKVERGWSEGEVGRGRGESESDPEELDSETRNLGGFELLGMKLIPQLSRFHAKQLCPIPSSDHTYQEAIQLLSDSPALIVVLRGIACNRRLQQLLQPKPLRFSSRQSLSLSLLISDSLSHAFRHITMFFNDKELFCDPTSWPLVTMVPSAWARTDVLHDLQQPPLLLLSVLVAIVRGGGEWRVLVKVMERLWRTGFQVCGVTMRRREEGEREQSSGENWESALQSTSATEAGCSSEVAVCVARQNAVWYLNHELTPFLSSTTQQNSLHCPTGFSAAVSLVQQFFPRGVCGPGTTIATDYGIKSGLTDDFSGLSSGVSPSPTSSPPSPLTESMCLVLPPSHLSSPSSPSHHSTPPYLQLLELVAQAGFIVTGVQMTHLSQVTADSLRAVSGVDNTELVAGPCLILQLQRDNAASCFQFILKSAAQYSVRGDSTDIDRLLAGAIVPDSQNTAKAIISSLMKEE